MFWFLLRRTIEKTHKREPIRNVLAFARDFSFLIKKEKGKKIPLIKTLIIFYTLLGMSTMYATSDHHNNPLYCDKWYNDLRYTEDANFVAVPVELYQNGSYQCGDKILIKWEDGTRLYSFALDAGDFISKSVLVNGQYIPIRVDVPSHLFTQPGISARASVLNISQLNRALPLDVKVGYLRK